MLCKPKKNTSEWSQYSLGRRGWYFFHPLSLKGSSLSNLNIFIVLGGNDEKVSKFFNKITKTLITEQLIIIKHYLYQMRVHKSTYSLNVKLKLP